MFTEEQIKAIIQENERLRKENDALSGKVASLEQSLYWLRKKMFGRMSEKNLPLDPNQLSLFTQRTQGGRRDDKNNQGQREACPQAS